MAPSFNFTDDQKKQFAAALITLGEARAFDAAVSVFGDDKSTLGMSCYAATQWLTDPIVIAEKTRLLSKENVGQFLPTKDQAARQLWDWCQSPFFEPKERVAAMKLYAEIQGFIADPKKSNAPLIPPAITYYRDETTLHEPPEAPVDAE